MAPATYRNQVWPKRNRRSGTSPYEARRSRLGGASGLGNAGYACQVRSEPAPSGFELIEIDDPGILASLHRVDAMSDDQIRDLVRGEPQIIVNAAEYLIAERHRGTSAARHDS